MGGLRRAAWIAIAIAVAIAPSSCAVPMRPPRGEAIVVVDTDMPVPKIVDRVRVDVYSVDGARWIASRDIARPRAEEWPFSFSVHTEAGFKDALVRIRAYRSAYVRDYRGERYSVQPPQAVGAERLVRADAPETPFSKTCPTCPRLVIDGVDVTPPTEPLPLVAIDRIVHLSLVEGQVGKTVVLLSGHCAGTQANLARGTTCIETEGVLEKPPLARIDPDLTMPASHVGEIEKPFAKPCAIAPRTGRMRAGAPLLDDEVCVPGGAFIFGSLETVSGSDADDFPPRVSIVPSFLIDRYEVDIARIRQAFDDGYTGTFDVLANDGPANDPMLGHSAPAACTWSTSPRGREDAPLNCMTQATAREICQFLGGDLPLEVQWEYVATWAGRAAKNVPSIVGSNGLVECAGVAMARDNVTTDPSSACMKISGFGTAPVTFGREHPRGDVAFGVVGLWGNVSERTRDAFASMGSICWLSAPIVSPTCAIEAGEKAAVRGAQWREPQNLQGWSWREGVIQTGVATTMGFRCTREANP